MSCSGMNQPIQDIILLVWWAGVTECTIWEYKF